MAQISLMLPVRITAEKFKNFRRYFQSISDCIADINNIEILVKFDEDQDISKALEVINEYKAKGLCIKHFHTPRGRGYMDSAFFYTQLLFYADPQSKLLSATSIDMLFIQKNFDTILLEACKKYDDGIFVIHPNAVFDLKHEITDINKAVQHVENFPFWSRKWVEVQGIFGYSSSTDGYTGLVEYLLYNEHKIDRRIALKTKLTKETDLGAPVTSKYWQGPRKTAMEIHLSQQSVAFAKQAAKNLAMNIIGGGVQVPIQNI